VVTGSLNMDFVVRVPRLAAPGETVLGRDFQLLPGGKGANQACAAGKLSLSSTVRMVGRVGYDVFADQLKASLAASGVDVSAVAGTRSQSTGVAMIWVEEAGQNSIVVASGANFAFTAADVEGARNAYRGARYALFQLETPLEAVQAAMQVARSAGARTILDPAPAQMLGPSLLAAVDILTPNETEAYVLLGRAPSRVLPEDAPALARALLSLGPRAILLKLGDKGSFYLDADSEIYSPSFEVDPVDSTAAGDTFNGALAVALAEGRSMHDALRFANAAAALSVLKVGAQASIPARSEVDTLLASVSSL
jgi:ribokinase